MSESTTPAQCRDDDWNLARDCGLMAATPGTNAWDAALGRFADGVRATDAVGELAPLWVIHIEGPDDLIAAPTKKEAERVAAAVNAVHDHHAAKRRSEIAASGGNPDFYPTTKAVVAQWNGTAADHMTSLAADWDGYIEYIEAARIITAPAPSASPAPVTGIGNGSPDYEQGYADGRRDTRAVMISEGYRKPDEYASPADATPIASKEAA